MIFIFTIFCKINKFSAVPPVQKEALVSVHVSSAHIPSITFGTGGEAARSRFP